MTWWPHTAPGLQALNGWAMVVATVTGALALGAGWIANSANNQAGDLIQADADRRIAEANARGREALTKGAAASRDAAKANEGIAIAQTETAKANALAANANERTALLEQANLKLEEAIAPRRISDQQKVELVNSLKAFAGHKVQVSSYAMDAEGMLLGHALLRIMQEAGIKVSGLTAVVPITTLRAGIHVTALNEGNRVFAHGLAEAIARQTALMVTYNPKIQVDEEQLELGGTGNLSQFEAVFLVGTKPIKKDSSIKLQRQD